jgi:hypothetical protein
MQTLKRMCDCTQQGVLAGGGRTHITCAELVAKIHAHMIKTPLVTVLLLVRRSDRSDREVNIQAQMRDLI